MQIKIDYIRLENFKGVESFLLKLGGESATVTGENGTGKTTLADAFFWLFDNSNLDQRSNFNIVKLDENGIPVNKLDASVEARFWFGSRLITLKKIYRQKWVKKAGSLEPVFSGYTTDHFINDEPLSKKEYDAQLSDLDTKIFRSLSDPLYFCGRSDTKWRRDILFDLCGTITDDQIFELYEKFKPLRDTLDGTSHTAYRKICKKKQKDLQTQLNELPAMIRALKESAPDISGLDEAELRKQLDEVDTKISDQRNDTDRIKRQKRIALLESELVEVETQAKKELANSELIDNKNFLIQTDQNLRELENQEHRLKELESEREALIESWKQVNAKAFKSSKYCFTCGQELPEHQIAEQQDKFNEQKANELKEINEVGKKCKTAIDATQKLIEGLVSRNEKLKKQIADSQKAKDDIKTKIETELSQKQEAIQKQIIELQSIKDDEIDYSLEDQRSKIQSLLLDLTQVDKIERQIERYTENQKKFAAEHETLEKDLFLLDEFDRLKTEEIEKTVNSKFDLTDWKLFEILQNGNIRDICEPLFNGVPFSSDLNTGARINVGLDCINVLSEHFGIKCPIFVDNAESITNWIGTGSQIIRLRATKKGDKLNYEVNNAN